MPDTLHDRHVTSATGSWRAILRAELPQVARIVVAAAVAWEAALLLGATQPPIFAALVPLVSLRDDPFSAFNLSVARLVGVVAGLLIAIGVLAVLEPTTVAIAAVLALALLVGVVLRIGNVLNTQVAVSALLVFSSTDTAGYATSRAFPPTCSASARRSRRRARRPGGRSCGARPCARRPSSSPPGSSPSGWRGTWRSSPPRCRRSAPARRSGTTRCCGSTSSSPWSSRWSGPSRPRSPGQPYAEDLDRARAAVERFRGVDHSAMASVVRRPLHRMVDDLAAFRS
jgi:hypothetical protein